MSLDAFVALAFNSIVGHSQVVDALVYFCASTLAYLTAALFALLIIVRFTKHHDSVSLVFTALASAIIARFGITEIVRFFLHRPRPYLSIPVHNLLTDPAWSFPSGHATFFFALATSVYIGNRRWGTVFYVLAGIISLGRVVAGVHYPLDVIAGAGIGIFTAYMLHILFVRLRTKALH